MIENVKLFYFVTKTNIFERFKMTFHLISYFFRKYFSFKAKLFFSMLQYWTKCHRQFLWYSNTNMSIPLFSPSFHWKMIMVILHTLSINGPGPPIFMIFDSLYIKIKITKKRHFWQKLWTGRATLITLQNMLKTHKYFNFVLLLL